MNPKLEKITLKELKGGDIVFTATGELLMIHSDTISCQFPKKTIMPMLDEAVSHGILRLVDKEYWQMGMTIFIKEECLAELVMFLQKHTNSRVVI